MPIYIYGLVCPVDEMVRYVGKSTDPRRRLKAHLSGARRKAYDHHTARWIRRLLCDGLRPSLSILHEVGPGERWQDVEQKFIASAAERGWRLTNSTSGGEGLDYLDPENEAVYRANLKRAMSAFWETPEAKELQRRMRDAALEPAALARRNAAIRAAYQCPEAIARLSAAMRRVHTNPEVRAAKSAAMKRQWRQDEYRETTTALRNDPAFIEAQAERLTTRWSDAEHRDKLVTSRWTNEKRREQAARIANRNKTPDPEMVKRRNAAIKTAWDRRKAAQA